MERLAILLILLLASSVWAAEATDTKADAASSTPSDNDAIARDWERMFQEVPLKDVATVLESLREMDADSEGFTAQCKERAEVMTNAMVKVPVGLYLWYMGYKCAEAMGDQPAAEQRLERFSALLRYTFETAPPNEIGPIPILTTDDVTALIQASGQLHLYTYFAAVDLGRHHTMNVALWDEELKRERVLRLDYLDTLMKFRSMAEFASDPGARHSLRAEAVAAMKNEADSPWADLWSAQEVLALPTPEERISGLMDIARKGNLSATMFLLPTCIAARNEACSKAFIDAILPLAEQQLSLPMVHLALAYALGEGVKADRNAAVALLDAADRRLGELRGRKAFAMLGLATDTSERIWPLVHKEFAAAAKKGDDYALFLVGSMEPSEWIDRVADRADEHPMLAGLYGHYLNKMGNLGKSRPKHSIRHYVERAAEGGLQVSQTNLGLALMEGSTWAEKDPERGLYWLERASAGGDVRATNYIGMHYANLPATAENRQKAARLLHAAMRSGELAPAMKLAELFEAGGEGITGGPNEARKIYQAYAQLPAGAPARRSLARMLLSGAGASGEQGPVEAKLARSRAIELLRQDADKGDRDSQRALGTLYAAETDPQTRFKGIALLRTAGGEDETRALADAALALWFGTEKAPADRTAAVARWKVLTGNGLRRAHTDYAWALCTSTAPTLVDTQTAFELLARIEKHPANGWIIFDVHAACHAAAGDFDKAVESVRKALQTAVSLDASESSLLRMREHLAAFEQGRHIIATAGP